VQDRKVAPQASADPPLGLRERKRRATRRRLEEAALALAAAHGLDRATVEAISARADVSPRTFFNYFETKEDAVLGIHLVTIGDELLAEHADRYAGQDAVASTVGLLSMTAAAAITNEHREARRALVLANPQLLARFHAVMTGLADAVSGVVGRSLPGDPRWAPVAGEPGVADALIGLCFGAFRHFLMAVGSDPDLEEVERRTVNLVRTVLRTGGSAD